MCKGEQMHLADPTALHSTLAAEQQQQQQHMKAPTMHNNYVCVS
jgi:hypothetical protein